MSRYESKTVTVQKPICEMFSRFSDLSFFEKQLEQLPEEQRAKLGEVHFAPDSISIVPPQVGELKLQVIERHNFAEVSPEATDVTTVIDVEIPAMLRPFVGPKLQQAADKFGEMISNLSRS